MYCLSTSWNKSVKYQRINWAISITWCSHCPSLYLSLHHCIWFLISHLSSLYTNHLNSHTKTGTIKGRPSLILVFTTFSALELCPLIFRKIQILVFTQSINLPLSKWFEIYMLGQGKWKEDQVWCWSLPHFQF